MKGPTGNKTPDLAECDLAECDLAECDLAECDLAECGIVEKLVPTSHIHKYTHTRKRVKY